MNLRFEVLGSCDFCGAPAGEPIPTQHTLFGTRVSFNACECGLHQMNPHPAHDEYYDLFMKGVVGGKAYQMLQIEKFTVPEEIFVPGGNLWDLGCGLGKMLDAAKEYDMIAGGNDINLANVNYAREKGHFIWLGSTSGITLLVDRFDVVTMKSYLSHSFTPYTDICTAYEALKDGGILFIRTSVVKNIRSHELEVDHMSYYTRNCLIDMIQSAGFTIESVKELRPLRRDLYEVKLDIIARKE